MSKDIFDLVTEHSVTNYRCGARAGDQVRLKKELIVEDHRHRLVRTHPGGEIWTVLCGSVKEPDVVWLRQADGETHTWSDGTDFSNAFDILPHHSIYSGFQKSGACAAPLEGGS